ncbi:MAG: bifunctional hydroxymethylpyrimidine kinase/phosphomethylpyrimidine kinase, partial [Lachnospiraceae bacterium]|nr:bifunctional hydroxymethylpyrimidine kinase/phosphomethylpyrimidine kinase [Lachnospiraceae bacterium]
FASFISDLPYRDTKVILDTTGEALISALSYHPFLIKPNIEELCDLFHEEFSPNDINGIKSAAKRLQDKGARNVLTSMGEDGAVLITEDGQVYSRPAPAGIVVNTVGSGDSMVAGFLAGYLENGNMEDALCLGVCAGSASAFNEGFARGDEIMQLYRLIR